MDFRRSLRIRLAHSLGLAAAWLGNGLEMCVCLCACVLLEARVDNRANVKRGKKKSEDIIRRDTARGSAPRRTASVNDCRAAWYSLAERQKKVRSFSRETTASMDERGILDASRAAEAEAVDKRVAAVVYDSEKMLGRYRQRDRARAPRSTLRDAMSNEK